MHLNMWLVAGLLVLGAMAVGGQAAGPTDPTAKNFATALTLVPTSIPDSPNQFVLKAEQTVVAIGDSITAGGGYLRDCDVVLAREYPDLKLPKIVNKGISGEKAENLVGRFQRDVVALKPAVVTLSIGINDVWHRVGQPHKEEVLKAYGANLAKMVDQAQAAGIKVILLAPTVIMEDPEAEGNKRLVAYVAAMKQVAADKKCQFVDLHAMFLAALAKKPADVNGNWLTPDGVHMKPLGDAIMAVGVLRALGVPDARIGGGAASSQPGN